MANKGDLFNSLGIVRLKIIKHTNEVMVATLLDKHKVPIGILKEFFNEQNFLNEKEGLNIVNKCITNHSFAYPKVYFISELEKIIAINHVSGESLCRIIRRIYLNKFFFLGMINKIFNWAGIFSQQKPTTDIASYEKITNEWFKDNLNILKNILAFSLYTKIENAISLRLNNLNRHNFVLCHGDFTLGNILYDAEQDKLIVIDYAYMLYGPSCNDTIDLLLSIEEQRFFTPLYREKFFKKLINHVYTFSESSCQDKDTFCLVYLEKALRKLISCKKSTHIYSKFMFYFWLEKITTFARLL